MANGASLVVCMLVAAFGLGDRSLAAFEAAFLASFPAQEIMADIPNYTDQTPTIQISDVVVD
jgi:hypothetical protein